MKRSLAPLAAMALLMSGCAQDAAPSEATTEPTAIEEQEPTETSAPTTPEPTEDPSVEPTEEPGAEGEAEVREALTAPTDAPLVNPMASPEDQFLELYKQELQTLPEGPHEQIGTDADSIALGYQACDDLSVMSYGEALFAYAFDLESTEETVADYNAALNAAPLTLCP